MWIKWILVGMTLTFASWFLVGCGVAQEKYDLLLSDINKSKEELQSVKTEHEAALNKAQDELQSVKKELESATKELDEIKKVYPLRDFPSLRELQEWLIKNDVSRRSPTTSAEAWYSKALEIQEDAMRDGYMISVDEDSDDEGNASVYCVAVINGDIWYWDPETDEPTQNISWAKVK